MSNAHALLPPSSAARWVACAGSVMLAALYPETEETEERREGSAAHWAAQELLAGRDVCLGQVADNGVILSDEMVEGAELYVGAIDAKLAAHGMTRLHLHVEETIPISRVHEHNWGTPDAWFYDPVQRVIVLFDFKYGHRLVDVEENWQLVNYACGIIDKLELDGMADQATRVDFAIVQPRGYGHRDGPVRTWSCMASELRGHFNKLASAADAALKANALCTVNTECLDCPGRHACEALDRAGMYAVHVANQSSPLELTAPALSREIRILQHAAGVIKARLSGLEETATHRIKAGELVPGLEVVPTYGRMTWSVPVEQVLALGQLYGVNLSTPGTVTPTQAIKKLKLDEATVKSMSSRPFSGMQLTAVDTKAAARAFGKS